MFPFAGSSYKNKKVRQGIKSSKRTSTVFTLSVPHAESRISLQLLFCTQDLKERGENQERVYRKAGGMQSQNNFVGKVKKKSNSI